MTTKPANETYQAKSTTPKQQYMSYEAIQKHVCECIMQAAILEHVQPKREYPNWDLYGVFPAYQWFSDTYCLDPPMPIHERIRAFRQYMTRGIEQFTADFSQCLNSAAHITQFTQRFEQYLGEESLAFAEKIQRTVQNAGLQACIGTMSRENVVYFVFVEIDGKVFAAIRAAKDTREIDTLPERIRSCECDISLLRAALMYQAETDRKSRIYKDA